MRITLTGVGVVGVGLAVAPVPAGNSPLTLRAGTHFSIPCFHTRSVGSSVPAVANSLSSAPVTGP